MPLGQASRVRYTQYGPNQGAIRDANLARLPEILAAEQQNRVNQAQINNYLYQQKVAKKAQRQSEREGKASLAVEALGTGAKLAAGTDAGKKFIGSVGQKIGSAIGLGGGGPKPAIGGGYNPSTPGFQRITGGTAGAGGGATKQGLFSFSPRNTLLPGAIGFAGSKLFDGGKGNLLKKAGIGAGLGIISNLFLGTGGSAGANAVTGGVFGGLGGLVGGLF